MAKSREITDAQVYAPGSVAMILALITLVLAILLFVEVPNNNDVIQSVATTNGISATIVNRSLVLQSSGVEILKGPGFLSAETRDVTAVKLDGFEENQGEAIQASNSILSGLEKVLVMAATPLGITPTPGAIGSSDTVYEAANKVSGSVSSLISPFSVHGLIATNSQTPVNVWGSLSGSTTFPANSINAGFAMAMEVFGTIQNVAATAQSATFTLQLDESTIISITSPPTSTTPATWEMRVTYTFAFDGVNMLTNAICQLVQRNTGGFTDHFMLQSQSNNQMIFNYDVNHTFQLLGQTSNSSLTLSVISSVCTSVGGPR